MSNKKALIPTWIANFKELEYKGEDFSVHCTACNETFTAEKKGRVTRHVSTRKHMKNCDLIKKEPGEPEDINYDLAIALIGSGSPLKVIRNPHMQKFLSTYFTGLNIPTEGELREAYLSHAFDPVIASIREDLKDKYIWLNLNETTDGCEREHYIAYLIVGSLSPLSTTRSHLISAKSLQDAEDLSTALSDFVQNSLKFLWGEDAEKNKDKAVVLVTNAESHMSKAAKALTDVYPNLIHVCCLVNIMNKVAETVAGKYEKVGKLMERVFEIFVKAPDRVEKFQDGLPNVSLPPEIDYGEGSTWLNAALYHADNYDKIKGLIAEFDTEESCSIEVAQSLYKDSTIKKDLAFIKKHFVFWPSNISRLSMSHQVNETLQITDHIYKMLKSVPDSLGDLVRERVDGLLDNSSGYHIFHQLFGGKLSKKKKEEKVIVNEDIIPHLKFAPMTLIDIEKADNLKEILTESKDVPHEDLEKLLIINYEQRMEHFFTRGKRKRKAKESEKEEEEESSDEADFDKADSGEAGSGEADSGEAGPS